MDIVGLKIGGSIATYKNVDVFPLDFDEIKKNSSSYIKYDNIKFVGKQILPLIGKINIYLGLGVGPFGHYLVDRWDRLKEKDIVHKSVSLYCKEVSKIFRDIGLPVTYDEKYSPIHTTRYKNGELKVEKLRKWVEKELRENRIPIMHGDMVSADNGEYDGFRVASTDRLIPKLAIELKAKRIVAVTDVDGLCTDDPKINPNAKLIPIIRPGEKIIAKMDKGFGSDVTKRIMGKVEDFIIAAENGIEGYIVNAVDNRVKEALIGEMVMGTLILPKKIHVKK